MHFLYFVITEPENDKPFDALKANQTVMEVLNDNNFASDSGGFWSSSKADWFVIGGRWSGELSRLKMDKDYYKEIKTQLNLHTDYLTDTDIKKYSDELQKIWKDMEGMGMNPYARSSYQINGDIDDSMVITKELLKKIKERYEEKGEFGPVECFISEDYDEIDVQNLKEDSIGKIITVIDYHN